MLFNCFLRASSASCTLRILSTSSLTALSNSQRCSYDSTHHNTQTLSNSNFTKRSTNSLFVPTQRSDRQRHSSNRRLVGMLLNRLNSSSRRDTAVLELGEGDTREVLGEATRVVLGDTTRAVLGNADTTLGEADTTLGEEDTTSNREWIGELTFTPSSFRNTSRTSPTSSFIGFSELDYTSRSSTHNTPSHCCRSSTQTEAPCDSLSTLSHKHTQHARIPPTMPLSPYAPSCTYRSPSCSTPTPQLNTHFAYIDCLLDFAYHVEHAVLQT